MKNNTLLIGKDFLEDDGFVSYSKDKEIALVCTTKSEKAKGQENSLFEGSKTMIPWERSSSLSAHNLIIRSESALGEIDRAILYFDRFNFLNHYAHLEKNRIQTISDEIIASYQYMSQALLERFKEKKRGDLVFLLKEGKGQYELDCPYIHVAQEAFVAFSEIISYQYREILHNSIILVRTMMREDVEIAPLLFKLLDDEKLDKKLKRNSPHWFQLQNSSEGALRFLK